MGEKYVVENHDDNIHSHSINPPPLDDTKYSNHLQILIDNIKFSKEELKHKNFTHHTQSYKDIVLRQVSNSQ